MRGTSLLYMHAGIRSCANRWFTLTRIFTFKGTSPANHFCTTSKASECLTTLSLTVFIQRNFVAEFLQVKCNFTRKTSALRFLSPFWGLGATYDVHLRLIGKCVVNFLLPLIELFSLSGAGWGAGEYRLKIGVFAPTGSAWPKISGTRDRLSPTLSEN